MSILGNILGKIFNRDKPAPSAPPQPAPTATPVQPPVTTAAAVAPQPAEPVDVAGIVAQGRTLVLVTHAATAIAHAHRAITIADGHVVNDTARALRA